MISKQCRQEYVFGTNIRLLVVKAFAFSCCAFAISCGVTSPYRGLRGIEFIAPRGQPAASSLIWSKSSSETLLVNASEVGPGFQLEGSEVYLLDRLSGRAQTIATTDNEVIAAQTWSPDNRRVVLSIPRAAKGYEKYQGLWIWSAETGSLEFLVASGSAIWSPKATPIAIFEISESMEGTTLHLVDPNTRHENVQDLGEVGAKGYVTGADWSPDGSRLVLAIGDSRLSIPFDLYTYDISSQQLLRITTKGEASSPAWSPDGDRIAYIVHSPDTGKDTLHIMEVQGGCDVAVPRIEWISSPSWSPNGKQLAFVGSDGIYDIDLATFMRTYSGGRVCMNF